MGMSFYGTIKKLSHYYPHVMRVLRVHLIFFFKIDKMRFNLTDIAIDVNGLFCGCATDLLTIYYF